MEEINSAYRLASLFDGPYDGERVKFNKNRYLINRFSDLTIRSVFLFHLIIFITDNEFLKRELIYFKFSNDGYGYR